MKLGLTKIRKCLEKLQVGYTPKDDCWTKEDQQVLNAFTPPGYFLISYDEYHRLLVKAGEKIDMTNADNADEKQNPSSDVSAESN